MSDLTPAELQFFETGELPPELAAPAPAPAPAPSPAPAPAPAASPTPTPAPAPMPVTDDLAAQLAAERAARNRLEASLGQITETLKTMAPAPAPAPAPPDPANDPLGAMLHKLDQVTQEVNELRKSQTQSTQLTEQQREFTNFATSLKAVRDEFSKVQTDFGDAYKHLRAARADDLRDVGVPEDQIAQALLQDEIAVSRNAINQGKNPAQVVYNMAKRYGYVPKAAAAAPAERVAQLIAGQAAAVAPDRAAGDQALTFEGLKDAGDGELNKLVADDKLWSRLVGNTSHDIF